MPSTEPSIVYVPKMSFIAVRGTGDPNEEDGEYKHALGLLYGIAYTLKMSSRSGHKINGFYDYVIPPLEGFWEMHNGKDSFTWISVIRIPDFVTKDDFCWALETASAKKKMDFSKVEYLTIEEGLTVQCMHIGTYDTEPETISIMKEFAESNGYAEDFSDTRMHHEIYLNDPRKTVPSKLKTVIRHPVRHVRAEV